MRSSRVFGTAIVWIAVIFGLGLLTNQLRYTEFVERVIDQATLDQMERIYNASGTGEQFGYFPSFTTMDQNTIFVSGFMQIAIFGLCFFLIVGAIAATIAMWTSLEHDAKAERDVARMRIEAGVEAATVNKAKRGQRARVQRLLESMDADTLEALEDQYDAPERLENLLMQQKR